MSKNSFAELTNSVKTMASGLRANEADVARKGIDIAFIDELDVRLDRINFIDNEQETLKAKLKTKTSELDGHVTDIKSMLKEATQTVKLAIPQEGWKEFGISASR
jgi:hypothetical protein